MKLTFTVSEAGVYSLTMPYYNSNGSDRRHTIVLDEDSISHDVSVPTKQSGVYSGIVNLTAGEHTVEVYCHYSLTAIFDYLLVSKVPTITKTLTSTGYASFSSTSNVSVPADIKVYTAAIKSDNSAVVLTQVSTDGSATVVPANTGVILKGEKSASVTMDVTTETNTFDDNQLIATSNNTTIPSEGTCYGLMANEEKFAIISGGITVSADKAYLKLSESGAKTLGIVLGDETTGIGEVKAVSAESGVYYNLSGQRVAQPTKGLYIVNGKKVIMK